MEFFAHSHAVSPEPLFDHLSKVAEFASDFAASIGSPDWGRLTGLWHDLGKYSAEFQAYLRSDAESENHLEPSSGRVDHSTAGAQHAATRLPGSLGRILAYCIAGHHSGLPDNIDGQGGRSGLTERLKKCVPDYSAAPTSLLNLPSPAMPALTWDRSHQSRAAFQLSVFCRMLFSCLVDADYLATETFMRPDQAKYRDRTLPKVTGLLPLLNDYLDGLRGRVKETSVNRARATVLAQCRTAAALPPGFFSLTVPTGGGKTLSSLAFALSHAAQHGLHRVIYAIPFTSIIEQNAKVFRDALSKAGDDVVLEHHSNFDPPDERDRDTDFEAETPWYRLAAENWDAPLVVTTNVQLFESLFANRPSRCRKLHRIARSVIILDECQTLPVTLLAPTLRMLEELCRNYGCTVVLCSATQPAVAARPDFRIGLKGVREIIDDPPQLYESLRRVDVQRLGNLSDDALVERLRQHEQVLCVVNTRGHAADLFSALRNSAEAPESVFHLSARMCAAHRTVVLDQIRERLDLGDPKPCLVVSTQLIEAGVDIDFPVVYRAMTGLDSIAQAAGRCNREGRSERGQVFVFETDVSPRGDLRQRRQIGSEVAGLPELEGGLLGLDAINRFFELSYWTQSSGWDQKGILGCFDLNKDGPNFQFRECADRYRLIADAQQPILVPYGEQGRELVDELRARTEPPGRDFNRRAQRYVVGVYEYQLAQLCRNHAVTQYHESFWVLENESNYDEQVGLRLDSQGFDPERFCL